LVTNELLLLKKKHNKIQKKKVISKVKEMTEEKIEINDSILLQWVNEIINFESKTEPSSSAHSNYLASIIGPSKTIMNEVPPNQQSNEINILDTFTHNIIFKILEKVFVERVDIYENKIPSSDYSVLKIEALDDNSSEKKWFTLYDKNENDNQNESKHDSNIFSPKIRPTPFKTDTLKLTLNGSLQLIDAIQVKGAKIYTDKDLDPSEDDSPFKNYSPLSKHMNSLVLNDLFADVYFEVEGKIIPAHKNILTCRSDYFKAMLTPSHSGFKEAKQNDSSNNESKPIYIPNIPYQ
jgi:hypothetical protein